MKLSALAPLFLLTLGTLTACGGGSKSPAPTPAKDTTAPVITLTGDSALTLSVGTAYSEQGATANDATDGSVDVTTTGTVDSAVVSSYTLTYSAKDAAGNASSATRTVNVVDDIAPVLVLNGVTPFSHNAGDDYADLGAVVSDNLDDASSITITTTDEVNAAVIGSYTVTYTATDAAGNVATPLIRTVNIEDLAGPVITLTGAAIIEHNYGDVYTDKGAIATDNVDGNVDVTTEITVLIDKIGSYSVIYTAKDALGHEATLERIVNVADLVGPVITLTGGNTITLGKGRVYKELGATALDNLDGAIVVGAPTGTVDYDTIGLYELTYTVTDAENNPSTLVRTVDVLTAKPFITTWKTDNPGNSNVDQITITTNTAAYPIEYKYSIDWGDGETNVDVRGDITHTYTNKSIDDTYTITISGDFPQLYFNGDDSEKLLTIEQWGDGALLSLTKAFNGCRNVVSNAIDSPNLRFVTDMSRMFYVATSFNQDLSAWDVSSVTNMQSMFEQARSFNQELSAWDVSSVTDMREMFSNASSFNQDLSAWDVSSVTSMGRMFLAAPISTLNFDSLLQAWSQQEVQSNVYLGMGDNGYSANSQAARNILTGTYGWTIDDGRG
ncbi:hypothetical protein CXF85_12040 [Colwellia sp. 75C3]|uniref:immunoglobulin-like domain-containing protein n=1 Tax=Colwellia sp. 75C3 TaxID=888425 RepID=UPI000C32CA4F|nr:immunoglobulin-like domain-containing protein [Colwellia sp. 75C3]PKG83071.1 hypothetical protein CXF85_12040 [Colwellia sp. 75C3]